MRPRVIAVFVTLAAVALAGCADDGATKTPIDPITLDDLIVKDGLNASHPAYGFLTNAALPVASVPGTLYEDIDGTRVWYKPAYRSLPGALNQLDALHQTEVQGGGRGIAIFGSLAFAGPNAGPLSIIDISDPENAKVLNTSADTPVRDADTILYPDGRLILITTQGGGNIVATDVTDPMHPKLASNVDTPAGNHNIAVVPGTPIVYNTGMDIIDYSNPEAPMVMGKFEGGDGCHDIAFFIDQAQEKSWALCAGYAQTEIWDIADPLAPSLLVAIDYPSVDKGIPVVGERLDDLGVPQDAGGLDVPCVDNPAPAGPGRTPCHTSATFPLSFSHLAILNHDATVLIMGDETGGGGINGCDFYVDGGEAGTASGPIGNLWFYDITDPKKPDLRGHYSPSFSDADGSCTAHFGKTIEDTNHVIMAFYSAGIVLVDFTDLSNPREVDRLDQGGNIWDVQYHQGYLFTGDMARGVDVIGLS